MLGGMTSRQFTEWAAFFKLENERIQRRANGKHDEENPPQSLDDKIKAIMGGIGKANGKKRCEGQPAS